MHRRTSRCRAARNVAAPALIVAISACVAVASTAPSSPQGAPPQVQACTLLTPGDVLKATGITVSGAVPSANLPGVIGRCSWPGANATRVVVTLTDTAHAKATMAAQAGAGGEAVSGIGSGAIAFPNAPAVGGYMVTAVDGKGGFGISIQGKAGTRERAIALAKTVAARRR